MEDTTFEQHHTGHVALRRGRVSLPGQIYHLTVTTRERAPIFRDFDAACAACRTFENSALLGEAALLAWVLMPDHAHWLLQLGESDCLSGVVNKLKSASARDVNRTLGRQGALWTRAFHDHALRKDETVEAVASYIIANPIRAGLASHPAHYPYWNTRFL